MIIAHFSGEKIVSSSSDAFSLYEKSLLGEKKSGRIEYSSVEGLYLVSSGRMEIIVGGKVFGEESLIRKLRKKDKKIEVKFDVFSDLRRKGVKPGKDHAKWILYTVRENEQLTWHDFAAKNRIAHSTKKNLLIGIVDEEGGIVYYEVGWVKA